MSVRSFHSIFMASVVAGAALGCYLVSLRVASERAALEDVEAQIVDTQSDIRLLQTEVGTRGRLAQLERWNVRVLELSAPNAGQILSDKFQLAQLIRPERKPALEAPVVLASAPAPQQAHALADDSDADVVAAPASELMHEASLEIPVREHPAIKAEPAKSVDAKTDQALKPAASKAVASLKKAGENKPKAAAPTVTRPVRTAKVDPLAPLPAQHSTATGSRLDR